MLLVLITKSKAVLKIFETFTGKQLRCRYCLKLQAQAKHFTEAGLNGRCFADALLPQNTSGQLLLRTNTQCIVNVPPKYWYYFPQNSILKAEDKRTGFLIGQTEATAQDVLEKLILKISENSNKTIYCRVHLLKYFSSYTSNFTKNRPLVRCFLGTPQKISAKAFS